MTTLITAAKETTKEAAWRNLDTFHEQKKYVSSTKRYFQGNSEARHTEIIQR